MLHLLQKSTELGMVGSQCTCEENVNPLLLVFQVQQTNVCERVPPSYYAELNPSSATKHLAVLELSHSSFRLRLAISICHESVFVGSHQAPRSILFQGRTGSTVRVLPELPDLS